VTPGLLTDQRSYKPIRYPWALQAMMRQHEIHWLPKEIPLGEDLRDWARMEPSVQAALSYIFRFFTQSDVEVGDCYMTKYAGVFRPVEVRNMLASFSNMETIHQVAYALLIETIGMPDSEFTAFLDEPSFMEKLDYMDAFGVGSVDDILRTTAMFGGATEGLSLYSQFAMLFSFPQRNLMKGMGQIVSWSVRDESLHAESVIRLHNTLAAEVGGRSPAVERDIIDVFRRVVELEDYFIDSVHDHGDLPLVTAEELHAYNRFIADWRLRQLRLPPLFGVTQHPIPWLQAAMSGVEHANFFEARSTEYSKAASRGEWGGGDGVWAQFEQLEERRRGA
jgi:ribonucleoside-diphosphate reductase beta chain